MLSRRSLFLITSVLALRRAFMRLMNHVRAEEA